MKGAFIITLSSSSSSSASMFFFFLSMSESIVHRIVSVANISKSNQQQRLYSWFFYNRVQRWVAFILTGGWPSHPRCGMWLIGRLNQLFTLPTLATAVWLCTNGSIFQVERAILQCNDGESRLGQASRVHHHLATLC